MLRIPMGTDDLLRVRLASSGAAATIEAVYSGIALRHPAATHLFGRWGRRMHPRLDQRMAPLFEVLTGPGRVPAFLIKRTDDPHALAEDLLATPAARLRAALVAEGVPATPFTRGLAGGDRGAREALAGAVLAYHGAFQDSTAAVGTLVDRDLAHRATLLAHHGIGALLDSLHPALRLRDGALELHGPAPDQEIDLAGRPVQLTPSVFIFDRPRVLAEPGGTCFVTYPVRGALAMGSADEHGDPLADLLGRTRAAALRALQAGRTTSELAQRLGVSLASASQHAAVLRRANLVATRREGRAVRHTLTPLGRRALAGAPELDS